MSSSSPLARTGRQRQRYVDQLRLVAGCIPYKLDDEISAIEGQNCNVKNRVLVLMISTPNREDLVFPKGGWEDDETLEQAACREALEEAGVRGTIGENPLGVWEFRSKSSQKSSSSSSLEGGCKGYMFALEVTEELDQWPGHDTYRRKWLRVEEAFKVCRYDWMRDALERFLAPLCEGKTCNEKRDEPEAELPVIPVPEIGVGSQMLLPGVGCLEVKHPDPSSANPVVQSSYNLKHFVFSFHPSS